MKWTKTAHPRHPMDRSDYKRLRLFFGTYKSVMIVVRDSLEYMWSLLFYRYYTKKEGGFTWYKRIKFYEKL